MQILDVQDDLNAVHGTRHHNLLQITILAGVSENERLVIIFFGLM